MLRMVVNKFNLFYRNIIELKPIHTLNNIKPFFFNFMQNKHRSHQ